MHSEPVPLFLQVARVSDDTGGGTQQLPFIHLLCDQIVDQRFHPTHPLTEIWSFSTMVIITFSIITSIFVIFIIFIIVFPLKAASKHLQTFMKISLRHSNASATADHRWRREAEVFCPCGAATSNSSALCVLLQKCTWKGFCFSKNAHVLSDQTRLLMFPCVQLSWTSEHRT